jgi:hypothetical protein
MPLAYERDDVKRRVVATYRGPFQVADTIALFERQLKDGTWTYGLLVDTRAMTGRPTAADLREFMKMESGTDSEKRPRGPLAIVATDATIYSAACVYALMGRSKRKIEAFRDRNDADRWLSEQTIASL